MNESLLNYDPAKTHVAQEPASTALIAKEPTSTPKPSLIPPVFTACGCCWVCCSFLSDPFQFICCGISCCGSTYEKSKYQDMVQESSYMSLDCFPASCNSFCWSACDLFTFPCMSKSKTCTPFSCLCCIDPCCVQFCKENRFSCPCCI